MQVGEKKTGTDESKFVHIFSKRSFPHLKMMFEQYKKVRLLKSVSYTKASLVYINVRLNIFNIQTSGKTIEESLKSEFTGDTESAFVTLGR